MDFKAILEREQAKLAALTPNERDGLHRLAAARPGSWSVPCGRCGGNGYTSRRLAHGQELRALCDACSASGLAASPALLGLVGALAALQTGCWGPAKATQAELDVHNAKVAEREAAAALDQQRAELALQLNEACFSAMRPALSPAERQEQAQRVLDLAAALGRLDEPPAAP